MRYDGRFQASLITCKRIAWAFGRMVAHIFSFELSMQIFVVLAAAEDIYPDAISFFFDFACLRRRLFFSWVPVARDGRYLPMAAGMVSISALSVCSLSIFSTVFRAMPTMDGGRIVHNADQIHSPKFGWHSPGAPSGCDILSIWSQLAVSAFLRRHILRSQSAVKISQGFSFQSRLHRLTV